MRRTTIVLLAAAALVSLVSETRAQSYTSDFRRDRWRDRDWRGPAPHYWYYSRGYHPSTAFEGYLRGYAALIEAQGVYGYLNSQAAINFEQARQMSYENDLRYAETFWEKRRLNAAQRAANARPPVTMDDIVRISEARRPAPPEPQYFDPGLGVVRWPAALTDEQFAAERAALEASFAGGQPLAVGQVRQLTDTMLKGLKARIGQLPPSEYLAAREFLTSLAFQAEQGQPVAGFAAH